MRKPRRGIVLSPEEGAQVRKFVEDAVLGTVDRLIELGYLLRAEGGLGKGPKGFAQQTEPLSENDRLATLDVLTSVVGRL